MNLRRQFYRSPPFSSSRGVFTSILPILPRFAPSWLFLPQYSSFSVLKDHPHGPIIPFVTFSSLSPSFPRLSFFSLSTRASQPSPFCPSLFQEVLIRGISPTFKHNVHLHPPSLCLPSFSMMHLVYSLGGLGPRSTPPVEVS